MKSKNFLIGLAVATGLIFSSCEKEKVSPDEQIPIDNQGINSESMTVLGNQLENPYSVINMKKAYSNLKSSSSETPDVNIETTHYYIRFLPKSEDELTILKQDTLLDLYDYPLDYEILSPGVYYHDPELPDSSITWQYCAVTIDKELPNVFYEKLADLYIPPLDEDDGGDLKSSNSLTYFYKNLEDEALRITNNLSESNLKSLKASKWRPVGTIKVYDDIIGGDIPLVGAMVRARRWFTTHKGYTNSNGYYSCDGRFRRDAIYSIKWERKYWDIRSGTWGQAFYNGPKKRGDWNLTITGGKSLHFATIHRAAYRHFYGNNLGMHRPYGSANNRWKICYYDKSGTGDFWGNTGSPGGILPDIRIYGNSGSSKLASLVFRTTAHEFGHAAHCASMGNIQYWQVSKIIYESWADAVEWALTNQEYKELGTTYNSSVVNNLNKQSWPYAGDSKGYTSLFIDLVDNYNQSREIQLPVITQMIM